MRNAFKTILDSDQYYYFNHKQKGAKQNIRTPIFVYKIGVCPKQKNILKPLFIGIFSNYEWLTRLIEVNKEGTQYDSYASIPHIPLNVASRKIGKAKRRKVWEKRNSKTSLNGMCFVCEKQIDYDDFECGHITAAFWGGDVSLSNLEPICCSCNRDMGIENLNEYKRKFYEM